MQKKAARERRISAQVCEKPALLLCLFENNCLHHGSQLHSLGLGRLAGDLPTDEVQVAGADLSSDVLARQNLFDIFVALTENIG